MDQRMLEHLLVQEVDEWHQVGAAEANHPTGHRCAAERDTEPGKLRLLAIKRQAIDELGGDDVRQERGRRQTLGEERQWGGRDLYPLPTARTAVLGSDVPQHPHLGGLVVELL